MTHTVRTSLVLFALATSTSTAARAQSTEAEEAQPSSAEPGAEPTSSAEPTTTSAEPTTTSAEPSSTSAEPTTTSAEATSAEGAEPQASAEPAAAPRGDEPTRLIDDLRLGLDDSGLGNGVWLTGGLFAGDVHTATPDAITMGTFDLGLRLALTEDARVSFDWGFAVADTRVRGAYMGPTTTDPFDTKHGRVEGRNADLTFEWLPSLGRDVRFGFGVGVAVPVAATTRLPSDAATQSVFDASTLVHDAYLAQHGGYRPWRYRPERVAVYVPLTLAIAFSDQLVLVADVAAAVGVRVLGGMGNEVLGDVTGGVELGVEVADFLRLGGRVNVTALALGTTTAASQPSAELWSRLELDPISVLLRGTLGLGGPFGVGSDFAGWGLHLGVAASF